MIATYRPAWREVRRVRVLGVLRTLRDGEVLYRVAFLEGCTEPFTVRGEFLVIEWEDVTT